MRAKRRIRSLSLVSILVLLVTTLIPVSPAFAAITWSTKAPMPTARFALDSAVVGGKLYAIGGWTNLSPLSTVEEYDPATNTWTTKAPMPTTRGHLAVAVVNNKIYAIGGGWATYYPTVEEYDPATNTWITKAPMPTARAYVAAGVVNNRIYVIGGFNTGGWLNTVEEYDPATNTWTTKASMPSAKGGVAAVVYNNKIFAIGGNYMNNMQATVEEYDPSVNTWVTRASMPTARWLHRAVVANNQIYVLGGSSAAGGVDSANPLATVERYDPSTDSWLTETPMSSLHSAFGAGVIGGKLYSVGGVNSVMEQSYTNITEEGAIVGVDTETVQVQATVDPTIELVINPTTLSFGNVNPSVGSYTQTKTATVKSNKNWQLLVRKVSDLTGANTNWVIPSSQLTFTSPAQTNAQFQTTDTLVNSGNPTASTVTNITYNLTVSWLDPPDSYSAEHTYTAIQP